MDFAWKEEQQQVADALQRWIARDYDFAARRAIVASPEGVSAPAWAALAELGMLALPVPASCGGFDGSTLDLHGVMRELGRGLVVEPYLATVLAVRVLAAGGGHAALLEQVAAGGKRLACAFGERAARHDWTAIATRAARVGDGYVLDGDKTVVLHGAQADALLVSARLDDGALAVFVIDGRAPGLERRDCRTLDGQRVASVRLTAVAASAAQRVGGPADAAALLDMAADHGAALLCAEALGAMEALFAATLDYLKTRQQFGAPIGRFQVLQHRMADMAIHLEQARSMALLAAIKADAADPVERRRAVSAAKYRVNQAARYIGQQAVQLHGGMGVTDELPAAHYFKRLSAIELTLGDADHHLARFIAQPGFAMEDA